jgi:hypothetical protein
MLEDISPFARHRFRNQGLGAARPRASARRDQFVEFVERHRSAKAQYIRFDAVGLRAAELLDRRPYTVWTCGLFAAEIARRLEPDLCRDFLCKGVLGGLAARDTLHECPAFVA